MIPLNHWLVACTADELAALGERPLGRTIASNRLVIWRDAAGAAHAVDDWCPHRGAPLSLGRVEAGRLVCGYHGLQMGCDGRAVAMPGQRVKAFPAVRRFPVRERGGFVFVWPGEPALAENAPLPALRWLDEPGWAYGGGVYRVQCEARLMIDNLMDLTHETYVHAGSIGQREIDEALPVTRVEGDTVITERQMQGVTAPPFWQAALRAQGLPEDARVDRWQVCRFSPPSQVMIDVGVAMAGEGAQLAPDDRKAAAVVVDFITPETDTSIWYFWGMARRFRADDEALTERIREGQGAIFAEDTAVLEAQQANLLRHPDRRLLRLNIDAGGVQARRVLDRLVAAERAAPATVATPPEVPADPR